MLKIRRSQLQIFESVSLAKFESEMLLHSKNFAPDICSNLENDTLRTAVHETISRAEGCGFTLRGPIRLYIEMAISQGIGFETDHVFAVFGEIIRADGNQMNKANSLYEEGLSYHDSIAGYMGDNIDRAKLRLAKFLTQTASLSSRSFEQNMLSFLEEIFPEKFVYAGHENMLRFIQKGRMVCEQEEFFALKQQRVIIALMFVFGHECLRDPFHPWIQKSLGAVSTDGFEKRLEGLGNKVRKLSSFY